MKRWTEIMKLKLFVILRNNQKKEKLLQLQVTLEQRMKLHIRIILLVTSVVNDRDNDHKHFEEAVELLEAV